MNVIPTHGVREYEVPLGQLNYKFVDFTAGPIEGVPNKWSHHLEAMHGLIFVVDLRWYDEYEESPHDDFSKTSLMQRSLDRYESIVKSPSTGNRPIILVLTNKDGLRDKLPSRPLSSAWGSYFGGANPDAAADFIMELFHSLSPERLLREPSGLYPFFWESKDANRIKNLFQTVQDVIIQKNLAPLLY